MVWDLCGPPDSSLNSIGFNVFWKRYYVSNVLLVICFSIFYLFIYPFFFFLVTLLRKVSPDFLGVPLGPCHALHCIFHIMFAWLKRLNLPTKKGKE